MCVLTSALRCDPVSADTCGVAVREDRRLLGPFMCSNTVDSQTTQTEAALPFFAECPSALRQLVGTQLRSNACPQTRLCSVVVSRKQVYLLYRVLPDHSRTWCGESPRLACGVSAPADPLRPATLPARLPSPLEPGRRLRWPVGPTGPVLVEAPHGSSCLFRWDSSLILGKLQAVLATVWLQFRLKCSLVESVEMSSSAVRAEPQSEGPCSHPLTPASPSPPEASTHPSALGIGLS